MTNRETDRDKSTGPGTGDPIEESFASPEIDNIESDFGDLDISDLEFGNIGRLSDPEPREAESSQDEQATEPFSGREQGQRKEPAEPEKDAGEEAKDRGENMTDQARGGDAPVKSGGETPETSEETTKALEESPGIPEVNPKTPEESPKTQEEKPETSEETPGKRDKEPQAADGDADMKIRVSKRKKRVESGDGDRKRDPEKEDDGDHKALRVRKRKKPVPEPEYDDEEDEELEEERASNRAWLIFLLVSSLVAAAVLGLYYGCTVRSVTVKGNTLYTSEEIAKYVISDDSQLRHNTAFLTVLYHTPFAPPIPFIEKTEVVPTSYDAIEIRVKEKELAAYIPYGGRNIYFDADGIVMENSPLTVKGVTYVTGITLNQAEIGMPLSSENSGGLILILDALQILRKYEIKAESVVLTKSGGVTMFMDNIRVILGRSDFELKIAKIAQLRPYLEGREGTIDLTNYSSSDQNIILK